MASTPFEQFLARADASSSNVNDGQNPTAELGRDRDLGDAFSDGMLQGAEGLGADVEYFKALFNTAIDNDTAAADNIRNARMREEFAASATKGMENFEQFLDEPTIEVFGTSRTQPYNSCRRWRSWGRRCFSWKKGNNRSGQESGQTHCHGFFEKNGKRHSYP